MLTPLNANLMHVILCGAGAAGFTVGLGAVSNTSLKNQVWYKKMVLFLKTTPFFAERKQNFNIWML